MSRKRLDLAVVELGLAPSREKAQALILAGSILVNDEPATKAGAPIRSSDHIRLRGAPLPYVGRGGEKLKGALDDFTVSVEGRVCLDVGSSTGGFTDCLLQSGASVVYALDVGTNQLDFKLRADPRVRVFEQTHINRLEQLPLDPLPDLITIDVSFISVRKVLPHLQSVFGTKGAGFEALVLIKPQFELEADEIGKGGIPRSLAAVDDMLRHMEAYFATENYTLRGIRPCHLKGKRSENQEFFAHLFWGN